MSSGTEPTLRNRWIRYPVLLSLWIIAGTMFTFQSYLYRLNVGQNVSWWGLYPGELFYFILWACFTPAVLWLSRRFRIERTNWAVRIGIHLFAGIATATLQRSLCDLILFNARATPDHPFSWQAFRNDVLGFADYGVFIYFIILFLSHALKYSRSLYDEQLKGSALKEELAIARLQALKMQLHPHFLFNTLNTISVLIREDPDAAERMLGLLSDLLRWTLQLMTSNEISLREEIQFIELYLQIEKARFGDRLSISMDLEEGTLNSFVPTLILQPIIENAMNHGIAKRRDSGKLQISSRRMNGNLVLRVLDDGYGISESDNGNPAKGIGLANTRTRLRTLFGEHHALSIRNTKPFGTEVELSFPDHSETR